MYFTLVSAISKVDSKGKISIPIGLRARLGLVEGSRVRIVLEKEKVFVSPTFGKSSVETKRKAFKINCKRYIYESEN